MLLYWNRRRTGNTPLEAMVFEYICLRGTADEMDTTVITDIANYYKNVLHEKIPIRQPFVGEEFNATKAGIHIDGIIKNEEIYNPFDTLKLLKRPIQIIITDKSGTAGIAYWINTHFGLEGDKKIDKRHPGVAKIYKKVLEEYEKGRITPISNEEMYTLVRKYIPELFISELDHLRDYVINLMTKYIEDLAQDPNIVSLDPQKIKKVLKTFLEDHPYVQFIYVVDNEGKPIIGLTNDFEYIKKFEELLKTETFENRDWFINPMKTGETYTSKFYTSKITSNLCITISTPVRNKYEEIIGVLGMDIKFEDVVKMENGSYEV
jgi:Isopropylmalate/homocitrate/citramalate synthases